MKKKLAGFVVLSLVVVLAACSNGGPSAASSTGNATLQGWPSGRTGTFNATALSVGSNASANVASASINASGQFSYNWATPPAGNMQRIGDTNPPACVNLSNPNARVATINFTAQATGLNSGVVRLANAATPGSNVYPQIQMGLIYSDTGFSITGTCTTGSGTSAGTLTYNANLAAGWNWIVTSISSATQATASSTNAIPSNVNWYYSGPQAASLSVQPFWLFH